MKNAIYKKGVFAIFVVSLMILSAFFVTSPAMAIKPQTVGTVTFNPSSGAFPGQLVTYTWSGLPSNLIAPVYVTVFINGAPYTTTLASYSAGTITGEFTMPNGQPGTTYSVYLEYKDSAGNYGISSTNKGKITVNLYAAPTGVAGDTLYTDNIMMPTTINGMVNYTGQKNVTAIFNTGSNNLNVITNSTFNASKSTTTLSSLNLSTMNVVIQTVYGGLQTFNQVYKYQNISMNSTAYNGGIANLALPASSIFTTTFSVSNGKITSIVLLAYINQTVNGQLVSFELNGKYTNTISSSGNYTMLGTINAIEPAMLKNNFTGQMSAAYDIVSFYQGTSYTYVNYTLSVNLNGNTYDNIVILKAQYINTTTVYGKSTTTTVISSDKLNVQSGYEFQSIYVSLRDPGIFGTFNQNYSNSKLMTGNLSFSFKNYSKSVLSGSFVWEDNMTGITITLNNVTLAGYLYLNITTNNYSPGVDYISPAVWNYSSLTTVYLINKTTGINISGKNSFTTQFSTPVLTGGQTKNVYLNNTEVTINTNFYDMIGYPYLVSAKVPYTQIELTYNNEIAYVSQNFSLVTKPYNLTVSNHYNSTLYTNINGFNITLNNNAGNLWINVTNENDTLYGFSSNGDISYYLTIKGSVSSTYVSEIYNANYTPSKVTQNIINKYAGSSTLSLSQNLTVSFTITDIYGSISYGFVKSGSLTVAYPAYSGSITINGMGISSISSLAFSAASSESSTGVITSTSGFKNSTVLGYYNTTFTVVKVIPALFGLSTMNGMAVLWANTTIINATHSIKLDPLFKGMQNDTIILTIYSLKPYYNLTSSVNSNSQYLNITGIGYSGYIQNVMISGTVTITDMYYAISNNYTYTGYVKEIPFLNTKTLTVNTYFNYTSGAVPTTTNVSTSNITAIIASPMINLTLTPEYNIYLQINITDLYNNYNYFWIYGGIMVSTYKGLFNYGNNSKMTLTGTSAGQVIIEAEVMESQLFISGTYGNITFTTNGVDVYNAGPIPISGITTVTNGFGSGTVSGELMITDFMPYIYSNDDYLSSFNVTGMLYVQGFYANNTAFGMTIMLNQTVVMQNWYMSTMTQSTVNYVYNGTYAMDNMGISPSYSYALLQGSGALVISISNNTIAEIATQTGQIVNISLKQLNAKIEGVWTTENNTYVEINTDYGNMMTALNSLNATIQNVNKNGIATIETSLGTIQTSINNLNSKIIALNGTVATISTSIGTIQTNINNLGTTINTINGNVNNLVGASVTIETMLGNITGHVIAIQNGTAKIATNMGEVTVAMQNVSSNMKQVATGVNDVMVWNIIVMILVLVTLVFVLIVILQVNRIAKKQSQHTTEEGNQ
ncbi:MAG: beta strand repeat-containing protein [Thermoplasmata archaeon]